MAENELYGYDVSRGWEMVPDPFKDVDNLSEAKLKELGFTLFVRCGIDGDVGVTVYRSSGPGYLLFADGADGTVETILATSFPSMVEVLGKLAPLTSCGELESIRSDLSDLRELAIGEDGPLRDAYLARCDREQPQGARRKGRVHLP